jgi:hypothetical protein
MEIQRMRTLIALNSRPAVFAKDTQTAKFVLNELKPFAGQNSWSGVCIHQPIDETLRLLKPLGSE